MNFYEVIMTNIIAGIDGATLKQIIEKVERLEDDKKAIADDIREVMQEAKSIGFDTKIIREVLKLRKMDNNDRFEKETLVDLYKRAIGMDSSSSSEDKETLEDVA
jgi:uncharacterized protein (UPF0335 family)